MRDLTTIDGVVELFVGATPPVGAPIEDWRAGFEEMAANFALPTDAVVTKIDTNGVPGQTVAAPGTDTRRIVIHFHSGGYVQGSSQAYREFAYRLSAAANALVLVPDYRLAPESPYPAAVDDARAVYEWALREYGAKNLVISGDSAGGGLAMALLQYLRDDEIDGPAGGIGISPLLDLAGESESMHSNAGTDPLISQSMVVDMGKVYIGDIDPHDYPYCSPVYGAKNDLPPLYLTASQDEVLRDDIVRYAEGVVEAGGQAETAFAPGMIHIWTFFPTLDQASASMVKIGQFARQVLA